MSYTTSIVREIQSRLVPIRQSAHHPIPYYSQFESSDLIANILSGRIDAVKDPKWKNSGANTKQEYTYWSHNTCGMACLKMILKYKTDTEIPIVTLAKKCTEYGGYIVKKDDAEGLFYEPFCRFVKKEFNLSASVAPFLTVKRILFETGKNNIVIASVDPAIRDKSNKQPANPGGHLVVVTGYDTKNNTMTIHNPSGDYKKSQENYEMTFEAFEKFFAGRGIVIYE